ncbi:MAG TPA: lipoyl(octanoyl) transferase LipB [Candidatus Sulfotelmatobacter sp.]|nr:lipoyl(octanoyl) transferase LipB [Candidatus Sulfotelmatobacter sp.]
MISIVQLGTIDYATGLRLQQQLVDLRKEGKIGDVLLLLEHSPVITLGRNAKAQNVIASPEFLKQRRVELFECDRGGDVTFHGPGQIVGYPIFDLRGFATPDGKRKTLGVIEFVRRLEDVLMRTCADFAIATKRVAGLTGVWTDPASEVDQVSQSLPDSLSFRAQARNLLSADATTDHAATSDSSRPVDRSSTAAADGPSNIVDEHDREGHDFSRAGKRPNEGRALAPEGEAKLAAIGVHISRFVTSHGFALNVNTDLSYFKLIIPCGITSKPVTSMQQELERELDLNTVAESISRNFGVVFQSQMLWVDTIDALLGRTVGTPMKVLQELRQIHGDEDTTWA